MVPNIEFHIFTIHLNLQREDNVFKKENLLIKDNIPGPKMSYCGGSTVLLNVQ